MISKTLIESAKIPDSLLTNLESRDVALWLRDLPRDLSGRETVNAFLGLPWRLIVSEFYDAELINALEVDAPLDDAMTRKRGFLQIIDDDPSRINLPQRSLPMYLLNGRETGSAPSDFKSRLRRLTMLDALRRSGVRELLIVSNGDPVPQDLQDLWSSGFRAFLTFVSQAEDAAKSIQKWIDLAGKETIAQIIKLDPATAISDIASSYSATYPEDRNVIRVRDRRGEFHRLDVTRADEPERPLTDFYTFIEERDLKPLAQAELSEDEFVSFFRNPESSWRPYAAGLPWIRDKQSLKEVFKCLQKLDSVGPEENCIAYISAESGAGGTTLARAIAWACARQGYPALVARPLPFVPDALPIVNFLTRVQGETPEITSNVGGGLQPSNRNSDSTTVRYEAPWLIVFDTLHWQYRDGELVRFLKEFMTSGRPVCLLVVAQSSVPISFYTQKFRCVAELNHSIDLDQAKELGRHLNQFLRLYGKSRSDAQWIRFYDDHTVRHLEGLAAFWVTLSFWIQGQYDLSESIQEWMYRAFKQNVTDPSVRGALLEIAALSSERLPMPSGLLPKSSGEWPMSQLIEDLRTALAALGLVRISADGEKHWALVHDILGRFLVNAVFFDFPAREALGFAEAKDAEHLRFLLLRQIAVKPALGERAYQSLGEDFATSIFKIDPDHGHGSLAFFWKEVLHALDSMPRSLRDTSRLFRHHTAISRRRVAKLDEKLYHVMPEDRIRLLNRAIEDMVYALNFIEYTPGAESNLNLLNSLANAYFDLEKVESARGATKERVAELRRLANDATRRAYEESPTNSFTIETYVKNLLRSAEDDGGHAIERCIEALGILFSALASNEAPYRTAQLADLADGALSILMKQTPPPGEGVQPTQPVQVLTQAWRVLAEGRSKRGDTTLWEIPEENRRRALDVLGNPVGRGNMQITRLQFDLTCIDQPYAFKRQLELVEQLETTDYRLTPQLRLEYAILLFQVGRSVEGDKVFRRLRTIWRESEHFVHIPERLRWLRAVDAKSLQTVHAIVGSDRSNRAMALVRDFGNVLVPFRPEEHGFREVRPQMRFACHVSFGHNGPFLRPVTARPREEE